jgi:hypothetical protein
VKTKIKFYDTGLEEENEVDIQDIETIEEGNECIIIINNDGFLFETNKIEFV